MGRDEDLSAFVAARWPTLVRSAQLLGCSPSEAEDVAQSTLMRCLVHWDKVDRAADRDAYVHRILINVLRAARRRRWNSETAVEFPPDRPGPDEFGAVETSDSVLRALRRLPLDQRVAVVLRYYLHQDEAQMASVLGVAPGTVKSRLSRALKTLAADDQLTDLRGTP